MGEAGLGGARGCPGTEPSSARPAQAHEFVDKQHITSNLTVRVSHALLQAGAMCRVSNPLGVTEKHIQLVGECQALFSAPGAPSRVSPPPWPQLPWGG